MAYAYVHHACGVVVLLKGCMDMSDQAVTATLRGLDVWFARGEMAQAARTAEDKGHWSYAASCWRIAIALTDAIDTQCAEAGDVSTLATCIHLGDIYRARLATCETHAAAS